MTGLLVLCALFSTLDAIWSDVWNHRDLIPEWCWRGDKSIHSDLLCRGYVDDGNLSSPHSEVRFDDGPIARRITGRNRNKLSTESNQGGHSQDQETQTDLFDDLETTNQNLHERGRSALPHVENEATTIEVRSQFNESLKCGNISLTVNHLSDHEHIQEQQQRNIVDLPGSPSARRNSSNSLHDRLTGNDLHKSPQQSQSQKSKTKKKKKKNQQKKIKVTTELYAGDDVTADLLSEFDSKKQDDQDTEDFKDSSNSQQDVKSLETSSFRPATDPRKVAAIKKKMQFARGGSEPKEMQSFQVTVYWEDIKSDMNDPWRYEKEIRIIMERHRNNHFIIPFLKTKGNPNIMGKKVSIDLCLTERNNVLIALRVFLDILSNPVSLKSTSAHQAVLEHVMLSLRELENRKDFEFIYRRFAIIEPPVKDRSLSQKEFHKYLLQQSRPKATPKQTSFNLQQYGYADRLVFQSVYRFFEVAVESMVVLMRDEAKVVMFTGISPKLETLDINISTVDQMVGKHNDFGSPYLELLSTNHLELLVETLPGLDNKIRNWRKICEHAIELQLILEDIITYHIKLVSIEKLLEWRAGPNRKKHNFTIFRHGKDWGSPLMIELVRCIARDTNINIIEKRRGLGRVVSGFLPPVRSLEFAVAVTSFFVFFLLLLRRSGFVLTADMLVY